MPKYEYLYYNCNDLLARSLSSIFLMFPRLTLD